MKCNGIAAATHNSGSAATDAESRNYHHPNLHHHKMCCVNLYQTVSECRLMEAPVLFF